MKKVLSFIYLLLLAFLLTGCSLLGGGEGGSGQFDEVDFDEVFLNVSTQIENKDAITGDITLPTKFGSVNIQWTSDDESIISSSGKVIRPEEDTRVIIKCKLSYNGQSQEYSIILTVKAKEIDITVVEVSSIKNIKTSEVGETYKTQGTVVASFKTGVIIQDNTDMIYCYLGSDKGLEYAVGDVIEILGQTSLYGGAVQFTEGSTIEKLSTTSVNPIDPDLMSSEEFLALAGQAGDIKAVRFEGTLAKSGNYYNLTIEGAEGNLQGSLCTPKDDLTEFVGKKVQVTGYFSYVITSAAGATYIYVAYTDIKLSDGETPPTPPTPTYSTFADVKAGATGTSYTVKDATVVAVGSTGFLAKDSTGYLFIYVGNDFANDVVIGDVLEINGVASVYGKAYQLGSATYEKKDTASVEHPSPRTLDAAAFSALDAETITIEYVTVEGTLRISGNYRNLEVEDASIAGSLLIPASTDVSALAGKKVVVTGYFVYVSGSTTKYITIIPIEVKESDIQPPVVETPVSTIATVITSATGKNYRVQGTVVATSKQSVLIKDDTGYLYCYFGSEYAKDLVVGDKIDVEGATSSYGGLVQFNRAGYKKLASGEFNPGNPTVLDKDAYDAINASTSLSVQYVELEGKISVSGNYVNFEVEGSTSQGSIVYPLEDYTGLNGKNVTITGYFVGITGSAKYFNVLATKLEEVGGGDVPPTPPTPTTITIAEAKALELNSTCAVQGTVIALSNESFLIQDTTGNILVYAGTGFAKDLVVGNVVEVSGTLKKYSNSLQISDPTYTIGEATETVEYPNPRVLDGAALDALNNGEAPVTEYVQIEGTLNISGKYHNVTVEGATLVGSLAAPAQDLSEFNGKTIKATGYFLYINGSSTKYANILVTNVEEVEGSDTPVEPEVDTIANIKAGEEGKLVAIEGTVVAISTQSFLIKDATGLMLAYVGEDYGNDLRAGTLVKVKGTSAMYGGVMQLSTPTYEVKGFDDAFTQPEPRVLDIEAYEALNVPYPSPEYVKLQAKLAVSGKYYNLTVGDSTLTGSIVYPVQDLSNLNDKDIEITGYFVYVSGSSKKYINFMITDVVEIIPDPFAELIASFAASNGLKTVSSIQFTTEYEGITISFVSSNPDLISNDGVVTTLPEQDTEVTFTVTMSNDSKTETATFTVIVKALDTVANLYSKTQDELDNERFAVQATVVATAEYGFLIKQDDAYVYVFYGNKYTKDLVAGDIVIVKGYLGYYNGALEFNNFIGYQKTGTDESFNPTFTAITLDQMAALVEEPVTTPLELHATIRLNGNYKNLEIEGTEIVGSIMANNDINLADYDGRTATVKGYYLYTSTSGETKYFNIMVTSIDIDQLAPEVAIAEIKESYASSNGLKTVSSLLFTTEYEGITISFVSSNPDVISNDGVVTTLPEQDTEVTFTVTMTNGTITDTCTFTVIVKALDTVANLYNKTQEELDNERFAVRGTVVATTEVGFLIKQDDAYVYVYYGKNYTKDLVIGDNVIVKGYLGYYNGTLEFNEFIGYAKDGEASVVTVEYPTADAAFFSNLVDDIHITPIETQGLIRMNNQYVNVDLYLTGLAGSLIKNDLDLSGFADKYVKIQGYFVYVAGGFYSIIPTFVEEIEMTYHTITLTYNSEQGEVNFDAEHLEYIPDGDIVVFYVLESNPEYVFDYAMLGEERIETKTIVLTNVTEDMSLSVFFKAVE